MTMFPSPPDQKIVLRQVPSETYVPVPAELALSAAMGDPELWRYAGSSVRIMVLASGTFEEHEGSHALPGLGAALLSTFMQESQTLRRTAWLRRVRAWARERREAAAE